MSGAHLGDDRLSAVLDGGAEPEDVAHAEACPACGARLGAWRQVSRLVAAWPTPADPAQRDAAVAAALTAVYRGAPVAAAGGERSGKPPADRNVRRRRGARSFVVQAAMAAAAAAVITGVAVGVSQSGGGRHSASVPPRSAIPPAATTGVTGGASSGTSASSVPSSSAHEPAPLGSYDSMTPLVSALRARLAAPPSASASSAAAPGASSTEPAACEAQASIAADVPAGTAPLVNGALTYRNVASLVFVYAKEGGHVVVVLGVSGCQTLAETIF